MGSTFFYNSIKVGADIHYLYDFIASNDTPELCTKCGCRDQHKYLKKDDILMLIDVTNNQYKMLESYCEDCKFIEKYPDKSKDNFAYFCTENLKQYRCGVEMGAFCDWDTMMYENISCVAVNYKLSLYIGQELMHDREF